MVCSSSALYLYRGCRISLRIHRSLNIRTIVLYKPECLRIVATLYLNNKPLKAIHKQNIWPSLSNKTYKRITHLKRQTGYAGTLLSYSYVLDRGLLCKAPASYLVLCQVSAGPFRQSLLYQSRYGLGPCRHCCSLSLWDVSRWPAVGPRRGSDRGRRRDLWKKDFV